ncbi:MAG: hypothetical protein J6D10_02830 [Clostridia bacterium]|nr:hypothetical protein [Clostridia bacterium]
MELNIFMRELESALIERGIAGETAKKHVANLGRTFTSDDLSEIEAIQSGSEIEQLADSISLILTKNTRNAAERQSPQKPQAESINPPSPKPAAPRPQKPVPVQARPVSPAPAARPKAQPYRQEPVPQKPARRVEIPDEDDDYYAYSPGEDATTRGMILFWVGLFLTLPLTIGLAAVLFGAFAALFVGLGVLIGVAAAGAGVSLVGIIFGVTQLFSFVAAGIYEIGLGIMVAGIALFASILIYNIAIRLLPWIISLLGNLLGWICGKVKSLFFVVRRECYKL